MPSSRRRGGTSMPLAGDDTMRPAMLISPSVGCSSPATHRSVVVLPQPDGPSSTTISPAGTAKLTPSIAGRPIVNCLRRPVTSSVAITNKPASCVYSLPISKCLVPFGDPGRMQFHIVVEFRIPDLHHLRVNPLGIEWRNLQRCEIPLLLDHKGLPFLRQTPVQVE